MAVAKMKKVTLLGHASVKAQLVKCLQEQGLLQIISAREEGEGEPPHELTAQLHEMEMAVHKANFLLTFLGEFVNEKRSFIRSMMTPRVYLTRTHYETIEGKIPFDELYESCEELDDELQAVRSARGRLTAQIGSLDSWIELDTALSARAGTHDTALLLGFLPAAALGEARTELSETAPESELEVVSEASQQVACAVLVHRSAAEEAQSLLTRHGFKPAVFDAALKAEPRVQVERLRGELAELDEKEEATLGRIGKLTALIDDIMVLREHLQDRYDRAATEDRFYHTKRSFLLEGWVKASDAGTVADTAKDVAHAVDIAVTDPEPDDVPPVELDNPRIFKPFESLTRLYGYPSHDEIDPTVFMGPFFFIFFGMALGDFGYGAVLALGCWWGIRHFDLRGNVRNFMHLMIYGGIGSMIVGVLTGGYFGVEPQYLPPVLRSLMQLDPLRQSTTFMLIAVGFGVVQVLLGVVLEGADAWRHGDWQAAIFDQATTLVFLVTALMTLTGWMTELVAGGLSPAMRVMYEKSLLAFGISTAALILLQGRVHEGFAPAVRAISGVDHQEKKKRSPTLVLLDGVIGLALLAAVYGWVATFFVANQAHGAIGQALLVLFVVGLAVSPLARRTAGGVWTGAYNLYGMSGFIGDFLSYARLMAIGLATVLIGMVINLMAVMVLGLPYGTGVVLFLLILVGGHSLNLIINLLGAFVHPTRLQFVEFFGKFYDDGGEKFSPLAIRTKHLIFVPEDGT